MIKQFHIDPSFSVYELTRRSMQDTAVMHHRKTMTVISNEIENATIVDDVKNTVFSSFQRMSRFLPQAGRYRELAAKSEHVYVFGVVDCDLPTIDNLTYVPLKPTDQLAKEWFCVSHGRDYFTALATEELSDIDDPDHLREFKGVWSFDAFMVELLYDWLARIVDLKQMPVRERNYLKQAELISNTIGRMAVRVMDHQDDDPVTYDELQSIMQSSLHPAHNHIKDVARR